MKRPFKVQDWIDFVQVHREINVHPQTSTEATLFYIEQLETKILTLREALELFTTAGLQNWGSRKWVYLEVSPEDMEQAREALRESE